MADITDSTGAMIGYLTLDLVDAQIIGPVVIKVKAADGRTFKSAAATSVMLTARKNGTADPYISLVTGFDLSGYTPGDYIAYDIRALGVQATGRSREAIALMLLDAAGAAGWND